MKRQETHSQAWVYTTLRAMGRATRVVMRDLDFLVEMKVLGDHQVLVAVVVNVHLVEGTAQCVDKNLNN